MKRPSEAFWLWLLGGFTITLCLMSLAALILALSQGYHCQDTGTFFSPGFTCAR